MNIRDFNKNDYQILVDLQNAIYPDIQAVVDDYINHDKLLDPKCKLRRWIAEKNGQPIGGGWYWQDAWLYDPQRFHFMIRVFPEFQNKGVGTALYEIIIKSLKEFNPNELRITVRESISEGLKFVEKRGYTELIRDQSSELEVNAFDSSKYSGIENKLKSKEIEIKTVTELKKESQWDRKLYSLFMELIKDVPGMEESSEINFEQWAKTELNNQDVPHDCYFVAINNNNFIGLSYAFVDLASDMLLTGLTAVKSDYRKQGIATAMKLKVIEYAKKNHKPIIRTGNEPDNPMLNINLQLGFKKIPAWIEFINKL
jgi:mycothiol synthase